GSPEPIPDLLDVKVETGSALPLPAKAQRGGPPALSLVLAEEVGVEPQRPTAPDNLVRAVGRPAHLGAPAVRLSTGRPRSEIVRARRRLSRQCAHKGDGG